MKNETKSLFARNMRVVRKFRGMTQGELGEKVGCSVASISRYESGKREPDNQTKKKIADAVGFLLSPLMNRFYAEDINNQKAIRVYDSEEEYKALFTNDLKITTESFGVTYTNEPNPTQGKIEFEKPSVLEKPFITTGYHEVAPDEATRETLGMNYPTKITTTAHPKGEPVRVKKEKPKMHQAFSIGNYATVSVDGSDYNDYVIVEANANQIKLVGKGHGGIEIDIIVYRTFHPEGGYKDEPDNERDLERFRMYAEAAAKAMSPDYEAILKEMLPDWEFVPSLYSDRKMYIAPKAHSGLGYSEFYIEALEGENLWEQAMKSILAQGLGWPKASPTSLELESGDWHMATYELDGEWVANYGHGTLHHAGGMQTAYSATGETKDEAVDTLKQGLLSLVCRWDKPIGFCVINEEEPQPEPDPTQQLIKDYASEEEVKRETLEKVKEAYDANALSTEPLETGVPSYPFEEGLKRIYDLPEAPDPELVAEVKRDLEGDNPIYDKLLAADGWEFTMTPNNGHMRIVYKRKGSGDFDHYLVNFQMIHDDSVERAKLSLISMILSDGRQRATELGKTKKITITQPKKPKKPWWKFW